MVTIRPALLAASALLALTACGDGNTIGEQRDGSSVPLGFEFAFVGAAAVARASDDDAGTAVPASVPVPVIDLSPEELAERIAAGNIRLIDVRTDAEVAEGMIPGAEHIALDRFDPAKLGASDGREVVLYCRSGRRSTMAAEKLAAALGKPVEHLAGGILAWKEAGQPITAP